MEKTKDLRRLKGIVIILLLVYVLFTLMNVLRGIWEYFIFFGKGELYFLAGFKDYASGIHLAVYASTYLMEIIFLFVLNRFIKKYRIGKGYHFLIILLSFLPIMNCFLFFIIKRKLNKQLMTDCGVNWSRSDHKIVANWILMVLFVFLSFVIPILSVYLTSKPNASSVTMYWSKVSILVKDTYFFTTSLIQLLYYLEFKRVLDRVEPGITAASLLDN